MFGTWLLTMLALALVSGVCLKASTETTSPKRKRIFLVIGWSAGLVDFWIISITVLPAIHSIVWGFICLVVALVVTVLFARAIAQAMMTDGTTQQEGR